MTLYPDLRRQLPKIIWASDAFPQAPSGGFADPLFDGTGWTPSGGLLDGKFTVGSSNIGFFDAELGFWDNNPAAPQDPFIRDGGVTKVLTGYDPGQKVAITMNMATILRYDVNIGIPSLRVGETVREFERFGSTIWNFGDTNTDQNQYVVGTADSSGNIEVEIRVDDAHPSYNLFLQWGEGIQTTLSPSGLLFVMPPDDPMVYSKPQAPFQQVQSAAGFRDGWAEQHQEVMECQVRAIPYQGASDDLSTWWGWDGAGGWHRFVEYFNDGGAFTFFPNQIDEATFYPCVAIEKTALKPDTDWVGHKRTSLKFRTTDGSVIVGY
jgi:hypothetical protein